MKKLIFLISATVMLTVTAAKAQSSSSSVGPLISDQVHKAGLDTTTNSGSVSQIIQIPNYQDIVTIQTAVTKLTGNPALGSVKLYGSVDGIKYDLVSTAADSLAVTNISGAQIHTWKISVSPFLYYKAVCHGGNGATQTSTVSTVALWRRRSVN